MAGRHPHSKPFPFKLGYRHRAFCEHVVAGAKPPEAYLMAGFKDRNNASQLMKRPEIQQELRMLRARARHRHDVTVDKLIDHYYEGMDLARATDNAGAYVAAVTALGKMLGLVVEKSEHDIYLIPKPALRPGTDVLLSPDEWARQWSPKEIEAKPNGHGNGHG